MQVIKRLIENWMNEEIVSDVENPNDKFHDGEVMWDEDDEERAQLDRFTRADQLRIDYNSFNLKASARISDFKYGWNNHRGLILWGSILIAITYTIQKFS